MTEKEKDGMDKYIMISNRREIRYLNRRVNKLGKSVMFLSLAGLCLGLAGVNMEKRLKKLERRNAASED